MYSRALVNKGDFDKAILVYEKALQRGSELRHGRMTPIQDEIEQIKTIKKFSEAMGKAPSWDNAHTFHFSKVEMITDIPKEYYIPLAKDIADIIEKERNLLEKIVGPVQKDVSYFRMIVPGRFKEYQKIRNSKKRKIPFTDDSGSAFNDDQGDELIIHFNGVSDRPVIARLLVSHLLKDFYGRLPSGSFLDLGLADYLANKVVKEDAKSIITEKVRRLNWLSDQGQLESAMGLFLVWNELGEYELGKGRKDFYLEAEEFHLRSWSMTAFFLDGKDPFFTKFFQDYLVYEFQKGPWMRPDVEQYFKEHLSQEQIHDLDQKWAKFVVHMNYDNI
jgi:hypothetical protein